MDGSMDGKLLSTHFVNFDVQVCFAPRMTADTSAFLYIRNACHMQQKGSSLPFLEFLLEKNRTFLTDIDGHYLALYTFVRNLETIEIWQVASLWCCRSRMD